MNRKILLRLFVLVAAMMCAMGASAAEAYACFTESDSTLTFYYDNLRSNREGITYPLNQGTQDPGWVRNGTSRFSRVVFSPSFAAARPTTTCSWFSGMENLKTIIGMNYLNTSEVIYMIRMFSECSSLKSLNVSNFNTAKVTHMHYMFNECSSLESLDVSGWNTANVTTMSYMFYNCGGLTSLNVSGWNTANVTNMECMFVSCSGLTSLDLSGWNTANVTDMMYLFKNCSQLATIFASSQWSTESLINSGNVWLFYGCTSLVGGQGTTFHPNKVNADYAHIDGGPSNPGYFTAEGAQPWTPPEAYACYTSSNTTLTFYYDNQRRFRTGDTYDMNTGENFPDWCTPYVFTTDVVFDPSFASFRPTSTYGWFYDMSHLTSITGMREYLNTSQVTVMSKMFEDCSSLMSLDVSSFNTSNATFMYDMFDGCSSLTSLDLSNFNTSNVTDIGWMFYGCSSLTSLDLSSFNTSNVTDMSRLFEDCSSLTSLDLGSFNTSNVTKMYNMFSGCSSLTSLDLSCFNTSKVTKMEYMFRDCSNLTTIYAGNEWSTAAVTSSDNMFNGCTSLVGGMGTTYDASHEDKAYAHIDCGPSNPGYLSRKYCFLENGIYYRITGQNTVDVSSEGEGFYSGEIVTIPPTVYHNGVTYQVTGIGQRAFYNCTDVDSVSIPATVTAIDNYAFYNCYNLEYVTLPAALTTIGDFAFDRCWNLRSITIPDNVTGIGIAAFMECSNLASVVIGSGVTSIGQQAFDHCTSLTSVVIPNSVTTIGKKAFYYNSNLERVVIGSGVTSIGSQAFYSCTNLRDITCRGTTPPTMAASDVFDSSAYTYATLIVPNGTKSAYQNADWWRNFANIDDTKCHDFVVNGIYYNITGGNTVEVSFKDSGFNSYSGNVTIPSSVDYNGTTYNVTGIGTGAFAICPALTGVTLPATVTYISDLAFYECSGLTSLTLPNALLTIGEQAFRGCTGLTSVTIPNAVTTIGEKAFYDCSGLTSVTIGTSVTFIASNAFGGCEALTHVTCLALTPPTMENEGVFEPETYEGTLTVHAASLSAYQAANWWKNFTTFTTLANGAYACYTPENTTLTFYYDDQRLLRPGMTYNLNSGSSSPGWQSSASNVTQVVFDPSFATARPVTTSRWFYGMSNLESIMGFEYLNTVQVTNMQGMFYNCSALTSLDVNSFNTAKVTTMADMFRGCSALTELDLRGFNTSSVTTMAAMFHSCSGLTSLDISNFNTAKVTTMQMMFYYCSGLTNLDLRSFNTTKVTNMDYMFWKCSGLTGIYVLNGWSTTAVTSSTAMFMGCTSLVGGQGTRYSSSHVDKAYAHIDGGSANPGYFTNANEMIQAYACYTSNNTTLTFYYDNQRSIRSGTFNLNYGEYNPTWNSSAAPSVTHVVFDPSFVDARPATTYKWFDSMTKLESITGMEHLNTSKVRSMGNMFYKCSKLTDLDLSNFNTANVTSMGQMFFECSGLTELDLSSFNTAKVKTMSQMFLSCSSLTTIYVGDDWNTDAVTSSSNMFQYCTNLVGGKGTTYDSSHVDKAYAHIDGGPSNPGYFTAKSTALRGDVNGDNNVTIADVSALIDYLLDSSNTINMAGADCNTDNDVTIADVSALIDYLLSGAW